MSSQTRNEALILNVLEADEYSEYALSQYGRLGTVKSGVLPENDCVDVWAIIIRLGRQINAEFLGSYPNLKYIISPTTGLNHIDLNECASRAIGVFSLKGQEKYLKHVTSTAEHTIALMFSLVRKIPSAHQDVVFRGEWNRDAFKGRQVSSLTLGLVGYGRIGSQVATYAKALGMTVRCFDPYVEWSMHGEDDDISCSLDELLSTSDILSIHADYRTENKLLIGPHEIRTMKKGGYLINTARGELIDEDALIEALSDGHLMGAAIDVITDEQSEENLKQRAIIRYGSENHNLIITPHVGGCTSDAMAITEDYMADMFLNEVG